MKSAVSCSGDDSGSQDRERKLSRTGEKAGIPVGEAYIGRIVRCAGCADRWKR